MNVNTSKLEYYCVKRLEEIFPLYIFSKFLGTGKVKFSRMRRAQ